MRNATEARCARARLYAIAKPMGKHTNAFAKYTTVSLDMHAANAATIYTSVVNPHAHCTMCTHSDRVWLTYGFVRNTAWILPCRYIHESECPFNLVVGSLFLPLFLSLYMYHVYISMNAAIMASGEFYSVLAFVGFSLTTGTGLIHCYEHTGPIGGLCTFSLDNRLWWQWHCHCQMPRSHCYIRRPNIYVYE